MQKPWVGVEPKTSQVDTLQSTYAISPGEIGSSHHPNGLSRTKLLLLPSAFVVLEALPLQPMGVDRRALPVPDRVKPELAGTCSTSNSHRGGASEHWAELLGLERVGIHDNFFD